MNNSPYLNRPVRSAAEVRHEERLNQLSRYWQHFRGMTPEQYRNSQRSKDMLIKRIDCVPHFLDYAHLTPEQIKAEHDATQLLREELHRLVARKS